MRHSRFLAAVGTAVAGTFAVLACTGEPPPAEAPSPDAASPPASDGAASDSSSNDVGVVDPPDPGQDASQRFCASQAPVTGVTDFFCADFDGEPLTEGFTSSYVPDGGALVRATAPVHSPPAALEPRRASVTWQKSGAAPFAEIDVQFRLHVEPVGGVAFGDGHLELLEVNVGQTSLALRFTRGGDVAGMPYTGYYLQPTHCPGACASLPGRKLPSPDLNVWTKVRVVWTSGGLVRVTYNDILVFSDTFEAVTSVNVRTSLGMSASANAPAAGRHLFDNVMIAVKRAE